MRRPCKGFYSQLSDPGIYTFLKNIKTTRTTGRNLKNIPTFAVVR